MAPEPNVGLMTDVVSAPDGADRLQPLQSSRAVGEGGLRLRGDCFQSLLLLLSVDSRKAEVSLRDSGYQRICAPTAPTDGEEDVVVGLGRSHLTP